MRENTLISHITGIIAGFDFSIPFHLFLKAYFKKNRQLGSRDRRWITSSCYTYFRFGKLFKDLSIEEVIAEGFHIQSEQHEFARYLMDHYQKSSSHHFSLYDLKQSPMVNRSFDWKSLFPCSHYISKAVDFYPFMFSLLEQPLTWIRIRKDFLDDVMDDLMLKIILPISGDRLLSLGFRPNEKLTDLESYANGWFEIQDVSSQNTLNLLPENLQGRWWDCCCGSGGKSLALSDRFPDLALTLTDNRKSIVENAKERFNKAHLQNISFKVHDATNPFPDTMQFDGIIADVPCSGSGTWARTPEQLWCFNEAELNRYADIQKNIVSNILNNLKPEGYLLYITCSVYSQENEAITTWMEQELPLQLLQSKFIEGYHRKSDTLYAALLQKQKY